MKPGDCDHVSSITVILLLGLFFLFCVSLEPRLSHAPAPTDWDLLIFTQNWPNSVCRAWKEKGKNNNTCNIPSPNNEWTIHGIWPTKLGTVGPGFCNPSSTFSMEDIYGILDRLENQWMRVENHKKRTMFWKHEWLKHGTCAAQLDSLNTEFKYFYQGLVWNLQYNMTDILSKEGLQPGTPNIQVDSVIGAVKKVLGKNPFVSCYVEPKTKDVFLLEVRICFDKSLSLMDCDGVVSEVGKPSLTDCPAGRSLLYPVGPPPPPPPPPPRPPLPRLLLLHRLISFIQWATL